ncbi:hypothetical protein H105_06654 [Trichophyton soudanense CBS 452.61]|uniref:F-box domain-containing protein n=1 Tax=Trichophyton soudanense CBS 452.61 TaxID=1215331 RepID=A0A022XJZ9_TRISD|nr:hypothetical protein H105_06654 [Trichophyton soudanense CBS 452.61]EZG02951.1 hypothetical protein H106_06482 [Trichophyton rubrum CBS 735.88]
MAASFELRARKSISAFEKASLAKLAWLRKNHNGVIQQDTQPLNISKPFSCWDELPVELVVNIFGLCRLQDLGSLLLVCRKFWYLLQVHEEAITREYLRIRRHGTLPSRNHKPSHYTRAPEDDVILLSDLFPPFVEDTSGREHYSFRYLADLRRRQEVCSKLSYYLADHVLDRFMEENPGWVKSLSHLPKPTQQKIMDRGNALLKSKLTPLMFYTMYFLKKYDEARLELQDSLYEAFEAGKLPVPVQPRDRSIMYRSLQTKILQAYPFLDSRALISAHHCIRLLIFSLHRVLVAETPVTTSCEKFIIMLLSTSGLERVTEFFAAEKGGSNQRAMRKEFMRKTQLDWDNYRNDPKALKVFDALSGDCHYPPLMTEIWTGPAIEEISRRKLLIQHSNEDFVTLWNDAHISLGCSYCARTNAKIKWQA